MGKVKTARSVTWTCDVCGAEDALHGEAASADKITRLHLLWPTPRALDLCGTCHRLAPKQDGAGKVLDALAALLVRRV